MRMLFRPQPSLPVVIAAIVIAAVPALGDNNEADVRAAVQAFYTAFDDGFTGPADYATEDWNHINPSGGRDRGREASLKEVRDVHKTFLKGTTDTVETMDIRFASSDVAVATAVSKMSPFTSPDGVKQGVSRHIRTFVLVRRSNRWQIMQDQSTTVEEPEPAKSRR